MLILHLDDDWTCQYIESESGLNAVSDQQVVIPQLATWRAEPPGAASRSTWVERHFRLYPTDACVNYLLHIDSAPQETQLSINGQALGRVAAPCHLDVTPQVFLDDNRIAFCVPGGASGAFAGVRLEAVPCE